jgi:hypothetical protein
MTPEEFQPFFWATVNSLPKPVRECITRYASECVTAELFVNDQAVFRVERKLGLPWVPAVMYDAFAWQSRYSFYHRTADSAIS